MDSYSCPHPDEQLIEDRLCGNVVCTGCGVVVESYLFDECAPFEPPVPSRPHKPAVRYVRPEPAAGDLPANIATKLPESVRIIKQICASLRLNDAVQDTACEIHKDAIIQKAATGGFRGKSFKASAVSAVYFACKLSNVARAEVEMHANYDITKTELVTMNKLLRQLLRASPYSEAMNAPLDPKQLLPRFIAALSTHPAVIPSDRMRAVRAVADTALSSKVLAALVEGRTPECVCAGALAYAVQRLTGVSVVALTSARCGTSVASLNAVVDAYLTSQTKEGRGSPGGTG